MNELFIDIETIPAGERPLPEEVSVPGTYKDPVKITEYQKANIETEFRKRSLITYKSEIIVISFAFDNDPVTTLYEFSDPEGHLTEQDIVRNLYYYILGNEDLRKDMQASKIIGHNVMFDIKTIVQRCFKYGFHVPELAVLHQYHNRVADTMKMFTLGDRQDYVSLDVVSKFLGIEQTKSMKGSEIYDEYLAGNITKIAEYCAGDVELTRKVYRKLTA